MLVTAHSLKMISLARASVLCTAICVVLFAHTTNGQKFSSKYDDIDIDDILSNSRLRNQYINCILDTGVCVTSAARFVKEIYAEALTNKCKRCSERQVMIFDKIADWFTTNDPKTWNHVVELAIEKIRDKHL